jgi:hypothetical protein
MKGHNEEKNPSKGVTHGIHLVQEDHCAKLSIVYCWRLAVLFEVS